MGSTKAPKTVYSQASLSFKPIQTDVKWGWLGDTVKKAVMSAGLFLIMGISVALVTEILGCEESAL